MYKCTECNCEFKKPKTIGGMGALWIIFILISMGLALILYVLVRDKKKKVCPVCKSDKIIDLKLFEKYNTNKGIK